MFHINIKLETQIILIADKKKSSFYWTAGVQDQSKNKSGEKCNSAKENRVNRVSNLKIKGWDQAKTMFNYRPYIPETHSEWDKVPNEKVTSLENENQIHSLLT